MLKKCARGWGERTLLHHRRIDFNGRSGILPKNVDEIYANKVRKMFRDLHVSADCLKKHFNFSIGIDSSTEATGQSA